MARPHTPDEPRSPTAVNRRQPSEVDADRRYTSTVRDNQVRIRTLTEGQFGLATWEQLRQRGVSEGAIRRWRDAERLFEIHPTVYSIVPPALMTVAAWHAAAVLAGGPGACLCAESAGWWAGVIKDRPPEIHVRTASDLKSPEGVVFHRISLREGEWGTMRGLPITAPVRIPLDVAPRMSRWELKGVLAELEFHHDLHPDQVARTLGRGRSGSKKLRQALAEHTPELALTRSELEKILARFCADRGFALPSFNARTGSATVDAVFWELGIVIEVDGVKGHSGERRILRDHRRDLHRRADGLLPIRYHYTQFVNPRDQQLVEAEFVRLGVPREPSWRAAGGREPRSSTAGNRR